MLPGASTIFWKNEPLTLGLLERLREAGMECVELTDYHPNWSYLKASWLRGLRADLEAAGLVTNSLHSHIAWYDPELVLFNPVQSRRERAVEAYLRAMDALEMIGCPILVVHDLVLPDAGDAEHEERRSLLVESLARVADYAAVSGISIAIENLTRGYAGDTHMLRQIVADTGRDNVGICIDTGHANLVSPVGDHVRAAGDALITLQIDDSSVEAPQHHLPGRGTTDWAGLMAALIEVGYSGNFVYELMNPSDELPLLAENYRWLLSLAPQVHSEG